MPASTVIKEVMLDVISFAAAYQAEDPLNDQGCIALANLTANVQHALTAMAHMLDGEFRKLKVSEVK